MSFSQSQVSKLESLVKEELLPVYLRYYRLLNMPNGLSSEQKELLHGFLPEEKLCLLVKPKNSALDPKSK